MLIQTSVKKKSVITRKKNPKRNYTRNRLVVGDEHRWKECVAWQDHLLDISLFVDINAQTERAQKQNYRHSYSTTHFIFLLVFFFFCGTMISLSKQKDKKNLLDLWTRRANSIKLVFIPMVSRIHFDLFTFLFDFFYYFCLPFLK